MTTWAQSMIIAFKLLKHSRRLNKMLVKFLCKCVINRGNWYSMYMHFLSDPKTSHRLYYTDIQRERWINYSSNQKMFQTTSVKTMIFSKPDSQILPTKISILSRRLSISGETHKEHFMETGEFEWPRVKFETTFALSYFAI